jgi:Vacuolar sorting 38 and autophagy-related subunit 14
MECDICMRPTSSKLSFYCPSCVRTGLYESRIQSTKIFLEKEQLTFQIEQITSSGQQQEIKAKPTTVNQDDVANRRWSIESNNVKGAQAKDRTKDIKEQSQILREDIRTAREEIIKRKAILQRKRAERDTIMSVLPDRRTGESHKLKNEIEKSMQSWDASYAKAVETRSFLCKEAAHLYGHKQRKKLRGGVVQDQYTIGGIPVVDLRDINNSRVNELTTSLTNTARLVVLVSFYLSLRLPAEITLPHRNYPLPTIFTPANSYQGREIPFPGTTPAPSSTNSPVSSRHADLRPLPRPRPLFIEPENLKDKIPNVAKRDPSAFAFFLEGISLLAWDVAWLCRSQGMYAGTESWEDVCNMGRNLYHLLIAPPQSPTLLRVISNSDARQPRTRAPDVKSSAQNRAVRLGHFSHDSAHSLSENDADFLRGWKVAKYTMIVDPLKRALIGEMSNAEWELLEHDEWEDGGGQLGNQEAVYIKSRNSAELGRSSFDDNRSVMTAGTDKKSDDTGDQKDASKEVANVGEAAGIARVRGTSGWTKLKNREK